MGRSYWRTYRTTPTRGRSSRSAKSGCSFNAKTLRCWNGGEAVPNESWLASDENPAQTFSAGVSRSGTTWWKNANALATKTCCASAVRRCESSGISGRIAEPRSDGASLADARGSRASPQPAKGSVEAHRKLIYLVLPAPAASDTSPFSPPPELASLTMDNLNSYSFDQRIGTGVFGDANTTHHSIGRDPGERCDSTDVRTDAPASKPHLHPD